MATPQRLLILGDFSGRAGREEPATANSIALRGPYLVDCDNLDAVMTRLGVELALTPDLRLRFRSLEDFHPDLLLARAPALLPPLATPAAAPSGVGLLDRMLEKAAPAPPAPPALPNDLADFIRRSVAPYLVPAESAAEKADRAAAERNRADALRGLLHHPAFQELEAAWRGLDFLVRAVASAADVKVYVLDWPLQEAAADLSREDLQKSPLYRVLTPPPGDERWTIVAGIYTFGDSIADLQLLERFGQMAAAAATPLVFAASPRLLGCDSLADTPHAGDWDRRRDAPLDAAWQRLRGLPLARWLALALPRFLLRLPYGAQTDPLESFAFEEMPGTPVHQDHLWGHPAFAYLACLALRSWSLPGIPLHTYRELGETIQFPQAEAFLSERTAEAILERGLIPVIGVKNQDTIRLFRSQSIAQT